MRAVSSPGGSPSEPPADDAATPGAARRARRPGSRAGIVSTMRFPAFGAHVVRSFVRYHARVGFERMYLFFDDPCDLAADLAAAALDGVEGGADDHDPSATPPPRAPSSFSSTPRCFKRTVAPCLGK